MIDPKLFVKPALTIDEQICLLEKRGYAKGVLKIKFNLSKMEIWASIELPK